MWSISQLKQRGKAAFKRNYWKSVLIFLVVSGLVSSAITITSQWSDDASQELEHRVYSNDFQTTNHNTLATNYAMEPGNDFSYDFGFDNNDDYSFYGNPFLYDDDSVFSDLPKERVTGFRSFLQGLSFGGVLVFAVLMFLISFGVSLAIIFFVQNPLAMGASRFALCNLQQPADAKEICYGFDRNYRNVVRVLFYRDLYIFLWCLLFIIPGIVKAYEYRMIPYLLAEHPEMPKEQAFATSRQMMMGEKGRAFLLDLSFIGWYLLSAFTFGALLIFYVGPYVMSTNAALYEFLKYSKGTSATHYYSTVPPVTPIPGYESGVAPSTPPMTPQAPEVPDTSSEPQDAPSETTVDAQTGLDDDMFEED